MSSSQKAPKPRKLGANKVERQRIDHKGQEISGWLFVLPMIIILGVFMFIPIIMALWVSVSNWSGRGTPFGSSVDFVGLKNYSDVLTAPGLAQSDFGTALRNNAWYTLIVVPLQTLLSLGLAVMLNRKILKARGFFRTAFYFPSVTSSVAITVLWLFLFKTVPTGSTIREASSISCCRLWASRMGRRRWPNTASLASAHGIGLPGLRWRWSPSSSWLFSPLRALLC